MEVRRRGGRTLSGKIPEREKVGEDLENGRWARCAITESAHRSDDGEGVPELGESKELGEDPKMTPSMMLDGKVFARSLNLFCESG